MLGRLVLVLLFALVALPLAVAPDCHAAAAPAAAAHHEHGGNKPAKHIPTENYCIGCVAPVTLGGVEVAPPPPPAPPKRKAEQSADSRRPTTPPATPPPRPGS
jgi:hypothetical protein